MAPAFGVSGYTPLTPGYSLRIDAKGEHLQPWWRPEQLPPLRYRNIDDYAAHLSELLDTTVARNLADIDGPLALELSGGMDTTTIASLVRDRHPDRPIHAYTRRFPMHPEAEEVHFAQDTANRLNLRLHDCHPLGSPEIPLGLETAEDGPWCLHDRMVSAGIRAAHADGCRVLLTGNGGDELFFGTTLAWTHPMLRLHLPTWRAVNRLRRQMGVDLPHLLVYVFLYPFLSTHQISRLRHLTRRATTASWAMDGTIVPGRTSRPAGTPNQRQLRALWASAGTPWLLNVARREVDGIRFRHPLFDRSLAEFVLRTPAEIWRKAELSKWPIRRLFRDRLPATVLQRRDKSDFQPIYHADFRRCATSLRRLVQEAPLADLRIADPAKLSQALEASLAPEGPPPGAALRTTIATAVWLRQYCD